MENTAIPFIIAGRPPSGRDLDLASEIHDASIEGLQSESARLCSPRFWARPSSHERPAAAFHRALDHDHHQEP
jgi:hypothetical protein